MQSNNSKRSKRGFWNSGFCSFLIIMFAFFFAFGMTCTIWKVVTKSQSVVSDGNVFGYSLVNVNSDAYTPTYKAGDTIVVYHANLEGVAVGSDIVYSVSNTNGMKYDICKLTNINLDEHKITIETNAGTRELNQSYYVGVVSETPELIAGIIEVINSDIMIWLFDIIFGLIFFTLLICRGRALSKSK